MLDYKAKFTLNRNRSSIMITNIKYFCMTSITFHIILEIDGIKYLCNAIDLYVNRLI